MPRPPERTLTAMLSPFAGGGQGEAGVLLVSGRADRLAAPPRERLAPIGEELVLGRGEVTGRSGGGLSLDDPLASSRHARITRVDEAFELRDEGSKNGTFLDGVRVTGAAPLVDGARVFVGNHLFVFRRVTPLDLEALEEERTRPLGPVATSSPVLALLCHKLRRLAPTDGELLLTGETGAGKEVYARAVHAASGRTGRFVAINCAALPRDLVESELFGYRPGAHSTAHVAKAGLVEEAEGGTLFLDELGEMALDAQGKLLRFLQDRELVPLGGTRPRRIDVRVIAATNRMVVGGGTAVRDDLLARLGAAPLTLPPLRDRIEDLGALIAFFARRGGTQALACELSAFRALALHRWQLNVRELEKVLGAALALIEGLRPIALRDLPEGLGQAPVTPALSRRAARKSPEPAPGPEELARLLARHQGQVAEVSRALGRQRAAVWRWIKQFGLSPDEYRRRDDGDPD